MKVSFNGNLKPTLFISYCWGDGNVYADELDWSCRGYRMAKKILKIWRKSIFSENVITENPENTPPVTQGSPSLIREGGRTVGSGRVATIIE